MNLVDVREGFRQFWDFQLGSIETLFAAGSVRLAPGAVLLYPTTLVVAECEGRFIFELTGSSQGRTPLTFRKARPRSLSGFFGGSRTSHAACGVDKAGMIFKDVGLACVDDPRLFNARIPGSNALFPSTIVAPARGPNGEFVNCLSFDHPDGNLPRISRCLFAHQHDELVRVRYFNFATYFHRSTPWRSVLSMLNEERAFDRFSGVLTAPEHLSGVLRATTAASSISTEGLLEPTITSLLNEDEFIRKAFGAVRAWSQPELQWVAGAPSDHRSIRPDFILQRIDGRLDIVDFKLPMLERRRVTVRGPSRRGFISPVSEGISQLANYEEFFSHAENRRRAEATLGVSVDSDVSLTLVVGTSENTVSTHLREASRPLKLNIQVLDYDSLVNLFLAGEVVAARAS